MEIPSSHAGVVKEVKVKLGDKVSEGSVVLVLEVAGETSAQNQAPALAEKAQAATPVVAAAPAPVTKTRLP
jgi:pyruvate/2-oxoglutarate dehydrogenase complex dihydrolipoamide acyltransferase (E2) component